MDATQRRALIAAGAIAGGAAAAIAARPRYTFRDKVVLVTGGSRGLGLVMARQLAREGARLAICARDADDLHRAAEDLEQRGADVLAMACDVGDAGEVEELIESVVDRWGRLDVLINNAGIIRMSPYEETTLDDYHALLDTHLFGCINTVQAAVPHMRRQGGGRIVNISSIGGLVSIPHLLAYSTSKHALTGYSRGLGIALRRYGIAVTTVCPGVLRTGSPARAEFKGHHRAEQTWFTLTASIPGTSISAHRAAAQVLRACRHGKARVTLSFSAKAAAFLETVAPSAIEAGFGAIYTMLPRSGGIGDEARDGIDSRAALSPSALTYLTNRAARRNNEIPPGRTWARRREEPSPADR